MSPDIDFPSIKTDISEFCTDFSKILAPFEEKLRKARREFDGKADTDTLRWPLAGISDAHHRLTALANKVEEQQAYVIIFGPLKSGKSTLMNAISGAYVSEVTSLPAYPCLVHVKYGEGYKFVATRYNGEKLTYKDNSSLQALIQKSHEELAEQLHKAEDEGREFDPGVDFPDALRRIDVEVPAPNLKQSLAVLVDTPGLYSRMKFGYDLLTREFRNSAASAVFVVKTDTLFLEQVFQEFGDLLDLFSRIFLVVNIDANKRDLEPDGSFKPSLESESPEKIIKAFESLVMSAPLRKASEEGRLKIYPVDLLNSAAAALKPKVDAPEEEKDGASKSLSGEKTGDEEVPGGDMSAGGVPKPDSPFAIEPREAEEPPAHDPSGRFSVFLEDLTSYLNSSDYLHEFMSDSARQGEALAEELRNHCSPEATAQFRERQVQIGRELQDADSQLGAIQKLETQDWQKAFGRQREDIHAQVRKFSGDLYQKVEQKALEELNGWFESDASLADLQRKWKTLFDKCREEVHKNSATHATELAGRPYGGSEITSEIRHAIDNLDEILAPAIRSAGEALGQASAKVGKESIALEPQHVKVNKGFWDWILLRREASVRQRLFGEDGVWEQPVSAQVKQRRLGDLGRDGLEKMVTDRLAALLPTEALAVSDDRFDNYVKTFSSKVSKALDASKKAGLDKKKSLEARLQDNSRIQHAIEQLAKSADEVTSLITELRDKYRLPGEGAAEDEILEIEGGEAAEAEVSEGEISAGEVSEGEISEAEASKAGEDVGQAASDADTEAFADGAETETKEAD